MTNIDKIVEYIKEGENNHKRIGLELEHFVYNDDLRIISYEDMTECLLEIAKQISGEPVRENNNIIGLMAEDYSLSLEPGCQLEISIISTEEISEIKRIYMEFRKIADAVFAKRGFRLYEQSVFPLIESGELNVDDISLLPKDRYKVMNDYFQTSGKLGKYMMRATASTQVSIDFHSEEDAILKLRVLEKIAPILSLLTENRNGIKRNKKWNPYLLRNQIWRDVDPARCGYFNGSVSNDYSFQKYAEHIYSHNSILMKENNELINTNNKTVSEYYHNREIENIDYILSMYFPHVRIKKYIEYRIADSLPIDYAIGYSVLIKHIVYHEEILKNLDSVLADITSVKQLYQAEDAISQAGYQAEVYGKPVTDWIEYLFKLVLPNTPGEEVPYLKKLIPLVMIHQQYKNIIKNNENNHIIEAEKIREYLLQSTAKYHNRVVRTMYIPKIFTWKEVEIFKGTICTLYGIFNKVIDHYRKDKDYRNLFDFPKELEELIMSEAAYRCNIPMSRIDLFYNEETKEFKFCEFNTDGASAMNEDRELNIAFSQSEAYKKFSALYDCTSFELFDSWVEEALSIYREYKKDASSVPKVAIVDFMENATVNEFHIFRDAFEKKGCTATVCDIRKLTWDGEKCFAENGEQIDLIYRRAVTSDVMEHISEVNAFLSAFKSKKVCVLGDFRTQIVHNKILFKILHRKETHEILNKKEIFFIKNHIPFTISLDNLFEEEYSALRNDVLANKNNWIIKPEDSYGSKGVHAGVELASDEEWKMVLENSKNMKYILQEFCVPYRLDNIDLMKEGYRWTDTSNLTGLFVYHEKMKGIYSRISYEHMISTQYNEMTLPTIVAG